MSKLHYRKAVTSLLSYSKHRFVWDHESLVQTSLEKITDNEIKGHALRGWTNLWNALPKYRRDPKEMPWEREHRWEEIEDREDYDSSECVFKR